MRKWQRVLKRHMYLDIGMVLAYFAIAISLLLFVEGIGHWVVIGYCLTVMTHLIVIHPLVVRRAKAKIAIVLEEEKKELISQLERANYSEP